MPLLKIATRTRQRRSNLLPRFFWEGISGDPNNVRRHRVELYPDGPSPGYVNTGVVVGGCVLFIPERVWRLYDRMKHLASDPNPDCIMLVEPALHDHIRLSEWLTEGVDIYDLFLDETESQIAWAAARFVWNNYEPLERKDFSLSRYRDKIKNYVRQAEHDLEDDR